MNDSVDNAAPEDTALEDTARRWAEHDPDPADREAVLGWIADGDTDSLRRAFHGPLAFGTAGLRAAVGPGESQLNRAVIRRTTAGLMAWLKSRVQDSTPVVVIGCDARHGSAEFRRDAAQVVAAAGGRALLLPAQNPTPLTAFTVRHLGADAGIMVTASHNPPADNGYKVYLGGRVAPRSGEGVQLIAPADKEIGEAIAAAPPADEVPRSDAAADSGAGIEKVDTRAQYAERALSLVGTGADAEAQRRDVTIALTAMHGVGAALTRDILSRAGFTVSLVPGQAEPDPDFPTVSFPNPEEKGALDLAKQHAVEVDADVILALDPDADRCAVAIPDQSEAAGEWRQRWRQLSGDETGALLGEYLATRYENENVEGALASSVVSSRLLAEIAAWHGLEHHTTLTGFKWIARTPRLLFGYEEAIGFCCDPAAVADKDGITASLVVASLVAELKAAGRGVGDALEDIAKRYGRYLTQPLTFRVADTGLIAKGMQKLRGTPPTSFAGSPVVETRDLAEDELGIGATDGMLFVTADNDQVVCRPSGTEPKLKCYLEVVLPADSTREEAEERLSVISDELTGFFDM